MCRPARLLLDAWSLAAPYWRSKERWRATILLAAVAFLTLAQVGLTVLLTYWQRALMNTLADKDWNGFLAIMLWWRQTPADGFVLSFGFIAAISVPIAVFSLYLRQDLQIRWRRWITEQYMDVWLADLAYYRMSLANPGADNPDQRIAEDARLFVDNTLILGLGILKSAASLLAFIAVLWALSPPIPAFGLTVPGCLVWVAILYALLGTWFTHFVGQRLMALDYLQQKVEADFRFALIRFYENAEAVAFCRGEADEKREMSDRFGAIAGNWRTIMAITRNVTLFTSGFGQLALLIPLAVTAPAYFVGSLTVGSVFQAINAFLQVQAALSWGVDNYAPLAAWSATVERLNGFSRAVAIARHHKQGPTVTVSNSADLELRELDIMLPEGRSLLHAKALRIGRGDRVLLTGPSGSGKSTLLRAVAGIWPFGSGQIGRPEGRQLFMPQRPYIPPGSLRRATCYPSVENEFSDDQIREALARSGLAHLSGRVGEVAAWGKRLSGGEQQRLALARALLIKPDWLFLDEATASLDPASEAHLYELLIEALPGTTLVSVAHHPELTKFHARMLHVEGGAIRDTSLIRATKLDAST